MTKIKFLTIAVFTLLGISQMDAQAFNGNGDKKAQVGFSPYGNGLGIQGTFDYGIHQNFSVGAGAEIYFDNDDDDDGDFYIYGRANAHLGQLLNMPTNMDLYPGIDLGVLGDDFDLGAHLGFRYFFQNNMGAYIEVGNRGSIGLSFNL
ncbi:hypothetical protein GO491_01250 [Flavobacteriaceae bacterium Ap0902]|nr:hypothetical protein [Flavobacteriaceae bacterium Ap0902]